MICTFERDSPRITAVEIHDWIFEKMDIPGQEVLKIQIDGLKRQVYIKVRTQDSLDDIITRIQGTLTYTHKEGIISTVKFGMAGLAGRRIRIAKLPPEMPGTKIIRALEPHGKVEDIGDEMLSQAYHYKVSNGVLIVQIEISKYVPSHLTIGGHRAFVSYDGQPPTCSACNASRH
jgi:hypothetical protein